MDLRYYEATTQQQSLPVQFLNRAGTGALLLTILVACCVAPLAVAGCLAGWLAAGCLAVAGWWAARRAASRRRAACWGRVERQELTEIWPSCSFPPVGYNWLYLCFACPGGNNW